jgi:hypothetical protein
MALTIEQWTGLSPEIETRPDDPYVFHVRLKVPTGQQVDRQVVEELLRTHKPAHAGYVLEIA